MQEHKAGGAHASIDDERNQHIKIYIINLGHLENSNIQACKH